MGTVFGALTAQKIAAIIRAKPTDKDGTANRRHPGGVEKGEVTVTTPSTSELLVEQTREAERLRLLLLANRCKDLDEFRRELERLLNRQ